MSEKRAKILVIDNYDSFVYNLVQYLGQLGAECTVLRNDEVTVEMADSFDGVLISPGPGTPEEAGVSIEMIKYAAEKKIPLFGVSWETPNFAKGHFMKRCPMQESAN